MQKKSYVLLGVIQSYAPDGDAQEQAAKAYRRMQGSLASEDKLVESLAGILVDGLRHGNWPWVKVGL